MNSVRTRRYERQSQHAGTPPMPHRAGPSARVPYDRICMCVRPGTRALRRAERRFRARFEPPRPGPCDDTGRSTAIARVSARRWILLGMATFKDQDLTDAEFRECDLTRARLIGVVMQDAVIDGLVSNLVVNGVEVTSYVEAELDRRHPVRLLIRSADPADLQEAFRQLRADWAATLEQLG